MHDQVTAIMDAAKAGDGGLVERLVHKFVNNEIAYRATPTQFRIGIDMVMALDNPIANLIDPFLTGHEDEYAKFLSDSVTNTFIPDQPKSMAAGSSGHSFLRARCHNRLVRHLKNKGMSHSEAVAKADEVTATQFDQAFAAVNDPVPVPDPVAPPEGFFQKLMAWLAANWGTILKVLLSLLGMVAFL